jgi:hypothetical protein
MHPCGPCGPGGLAPFPGFVPSAPVIPKLYWDAISQEQRIRRICEMLHKIFDYASQLGIAVNTDHATLEKLLDDFEKFKESGFLDYYEKQLTQWVRDNLATILHEILNQGVFFGLTQDGYFCANVVWQLMVTFDTIASYASDDYGKLVLNY